MENTKLTFEFAHVGINCSDTDEAFSVADLFSLLSGNEIKEGNSSIFVGNNIEIMKKNYLGTKGHLGIKTNDLEKAIIEVQKRGFEVDMETLKKDSSGKKKSVYIRGELGGFAIHLMLA